MLETIPETTKPILLAHKSISPMLLPLARMNSSAFSFLSDFVLVLLLFIQVPSSSSNDDLFTACSKKFVCGHISAGFPFWGNDRSPACGVPELELRCENNIAKMNISQVAYRVLEINQDDGILRIAREDYMVGLCSPQFMNSTFNPKVFEYVEGYKNLTFIYGCKDAPPTIPGRIPFICKINEVNDQGGYIQEGDTGPGECNRSVLVPVSKTDLPPIGIFPGWEELLRKGFEVRLKVDREACWECFTTSGACGIDCATNQTTCYCPNQSSGSKTCAILPAPAAPGKKSRNSALEIGLSSAGAVVGGALLGCWIMAFIQRRRRKAAVEKTEELPVATPPSKSLATSTNRSSNF
ncbi:hypothetical protein D5086_030979 [Populus alba]|uniref:Uncharacterized protein n=1 Tax=Populus alba TaxID=43335 RepID=A0ACC4AQ31_POPAL|nr:LEAF RUST 10 DISEASE-RESISTANCE LOCUS RECEPTOR-LIKE PROTEIN KINASE-like 1.3 [Populus alba]